MRVDKLVVIIRNKYMSPVAVPVCLIIFFRRLALPTMSLKHTAIAPNYLGIKVSQLLMCLSKNTKIVQCSQVCFICGVCFSIHEHSSESEVVCLLLGED